MQSGILAHLVQKQSKVIYRRDNWLKRVVKCALQKVKNCHFGGHGLT